MDQAVEEIGKIKANLPSFEFVYPPPEKIKRSLSREELAQHRKKKKEIRKAMKSLKEMKLTPEELLRYIESEIMDGSEDAE
jgi:hypothetical protein